MASHTARPLPGEAFSLTQESNIRSTFPFHSAW